MISICIAGNLRDRPGLGGEHLLLLEKNLLRRHLQYHFVSEPNRNVTP